MIEVIEQTIDGAKLDHDLIVPITNPYRHPRVAPTLEYPIFSDMIPQCA